MMGGFTLLRAALAAVLVGAVALGFTWSIDRFHQKALADAAARCEAAAITADEALRDCGANVAARIGAARRSDACDGALTPQLRPETRFTARLACQSGTLRLIAQGEADAARIAGLEAQLAQLRADSAAAVTRAEARAKLEQTRRDNARTAFDAAPRGADGSIVCDAACLRRLAN